MEISYLFATLVLVVFCSIVHGADYCSDEFQKICENKEHIGCNPKSFSQYPNCHNKNPKLMRITPGLKKYLLCKHNMYRDLLAGGTMQSRNGVFPSAGNMSVLQWDDELAALAEHNVKQCEMEHDQCRRTVKFKAAGQNIAYDSWSEKRPDKKKIIREAVFAWWNEHQDFQHHEVDKYVGSSSGVLHFTAMALDYQTHVGCAISEYDYSGGDTLLITCNYSSWTWMEQPIYKKGSPCADCGGQCDAKYKHLCPVKR
ncbi:hypothetical protein pipiens_014055 [Culex pipiens pipiens]|uniref:SCP domain-containing protein n=3 Tax=Culex pipiens TaxID=7175 RepID=A0ABD1CX68_CULPP